MEMLIADIPYLTYDVKAGYISFINIVLYTII